MAEQAPPRRKFWLYAFLFAVLLAGAALFTYWWLVWRFIEYTDDAYVDGNMVTLTPQIHGIVVSINADETDIVEKENLIIGLDPTDATLAYEEKKAELAEMLRMVVGYFERVGELKAQIEEKKATFWKSALDYEHRRILVDFGGVSYEDFEHAEAELRRSFAALVDVEHALVAALARVENTTVLDHPEVEKTKERLKEAYVRLQRCKIVAPVTGMVAQRKAQVGERVEAGSKLLSIVPLNEIWVYANFKEVQLKKMRIGQSVTMSADLYGHSLTYHGRIIGISAGTGSVFSIIPPQNATGNWIKIVQRLPVRISLDPEEIRKNPLRLGLSMEVTVDIRSTEGSVLPTPKIPTPIYQTDVFEKQLDGVEEVIQMIVQENVAPPFLEASYYE